MRVHAWRKAKQGGFDEKAAELMRRQGGGERSVQPLTSQIDGRLKLLLFIARIVCAVKILDAAQNIRVALGLCRRREAKVGEGPRICKSDRQRANLLRRKKY